VKCSWGKESGDPNNAQQTGQVNALYLFLLSALPEGQFRREIPPSVFSNIYIAARIKAENFSTLFHK